MNHLDLFSGIGGFSLAIKRSGITHGWHGYSDIDKYANNIFRRHFNEAEKLGGIESIQPRDLPKLDLVTFGFPCQDLSVAGKGGGLRAARSGLFFEAMRIIRAKRPRYIIFENVKGLLSSQGGSDFVICLQEIANAGYDGQWQLCNTRWVLPQNRERVFFVGHLRGERRPKVFPIESKSETSKRELGREVSPCLTARDYKGIGNAEMALVQVGSVANGDAGRVFDPKGISCTLKSEGGGWGAKTGLYNVKALDMYNKNIRDESPTLTDPCHNSIRLSVNSKIRRLTPIECERLQGFPDGWTEGQSNTQRYKQLGNAVSVPIVQEIIERLKKEI